MEQVQDSLFFRWFDGPGIDDPARVQTVFTVKRDLLPTTEMSRMRMAAIFAHRREAPLLSDDRFSVDGTLVKASSSMKSFQPGQRGPASLCSCCPRQGKTDRICTGPFSASCSQFEPFLRDLACAEPRGAFGPDLLPRDLRAL